MAFDTSVGGLSSELAVFLVLITVSLVLRFSARHKQHNAYGADDWLTIPAYLCFIGLVAIAIYGMQKKFIAFPTPPDLVFVMTWAPVLAKVYWIASLLNVVALGSIRLSALFFYRRIFCTAQQWDAFGVVTLVMIVIVCLWTTGFFLLAVLACGSEVDNIWNIQKAASCAIYPFGYGVGISSFILDFFVLIIPFPKIWTLHTNGTRKAAISMVFLLAVAGVSASCARMVIFIETVTQSRASNDKDIFLTNTRTLYYQILETGLCLLAVSLPTLWYFCSGVTPERVLRSVRSLVSIRSRASDSKVSIHGSTTKKSSSASDLGRDGSRDGSFHHGTPSKRDQYEMAPTTFDAHHGPRARQEAV